METRNPADALGYRLLLVLAFALPFDLTRHPLFSVDSLPVTNLQVLLLAVDAVALASIAIHVFGTARNATARAPTMPVRSWPRRRAAIAFFAALLVSSAISSWVAHDPYEGKVWIAALVMSGLVWLALPLWLAGDPGGRARQLAVAFVAGAVATAGVGFAEFLLGRGFDQSLVWFKAGPTTVGPYLRLSGTFRHANIAAMYFDLALPFAAVGLIDALRRRPRSWWSGAYAIRSLAWALACDVLLVALLLTYSRGGLVALAASVLVMAAVGVMRWDWRRIRQHAKPGLFVLANMVTVVVLFALSSSSIETLRFSTQTDLDWYRAAYAGAVPARFQVDQQRTIRVTITNRSPLTWKASPPHAYMLSYHWLHPSWAVAQFDTIMTRLPADVAPGHSLAVRAKVKAPSTAGRYLLVWDLLWNNTTWFGLKTATYQPFPVQVIDPHGQAGPLSHPSARSPDSQLTYLPTDRPLDRNQIWSAAVAMIERHPLFGVGPNGFTWNYPAYAKPIPGFSSTYVPPHAHNLMLEITADLGLVGGTLFVALFVAAWWPLLVAIWRRRVGMWQIAAIGAMAAFCAHGLVDYFLGSLAIMVMVWILSGLAVVDDPSSMG